MARTLPWLREPPPKPPQKARPPAAKRQKLHHSTSHSDYDSNAPPKPQRKAPLAAYRTPSTSPPPQPPSQHSMRPGLHADDIYIMVEDEFLATAQLYTQHLHNAEYQRLKALARTRNADMIRPVDQKSVVRAETRKKIEADARAEKIDNGIGAIMPKRRDNTDDESDFEIEKEDDPWQGTHLQRFLTASPRKTDRALMGLQGVVSSTRAAAGFDRPVQTARRVEATPSKPKASKTPAKEVMDEETDDDEDLDAPVSRAPSRVPAPVPRRALSPTLQRQKSQPSLPRRSAEEPKNEPKPERQPSRRSFLDMSPLPAIQRDPLPVPSINREPAPSVRPKNSDSPPSVLKSDTIRQRLKAKREREEVEKKKRLGIAEGGVDEIPIFLV